MKVYKLRFSLVIIGSFEQEDPITVDVITYDRRPPRAEFGNELKFFTITECKQTRIFGEVYSDIYFSNEEIWDYLYDFKDYIRNISQKMLSSLELEPKIFRL